MNEAVQFAEVQLLQATMAEGPARAHLLSEAKDALIRAERIEKGSGAWRMACVSALQGNEDLCRRWLVRARDHGAAPDRATLEKDPYLASMRDKAWFQDFLRNAD